MCKISFGVVAVGLGYSALAGCGQESGVVPKAAVEKEISGKYVEQTGQRAKAVSCSSDLMVKVGASVRCTLTAGDGSAHPVTVSVTSVSGKTVHDFIQLGDINTGTPAPTPNPTRS
jgi:Domain of unknown function (DUF4333)